MKTDDLRIVKTRPLLAPAILAEEIPLTDIASTRVWKARRAIEAILEGKEKYEIVDGNIDPHPLDTIGRIAREQPIEMLGVSVMPGPQMVQAIALSKEFRARYPKIPIVWGGYFPTQHTETVLKSTSVDFVIRSQGEGPLLQLIEALRIGWIPIPMRVIFGALPPRTDTEDEPPVTDLVKS